MSTQNAIIYSRSALATHGYPNYSPDYRVSALKELANNMGYTVLAQFTDDGKSGTTLQGRNGLEAALTYIQDKGNIAALIVSDLDRIARTEVDFFAVRAILRRHKVKLISKNNPTLETDSPEGVFTESIIAAVNAFQSRLLGRKVAEARRRMIEKGETPYRPPLGYKNVNKGVIVDPQIAPMITKMFQTFATGEYSTREIADKMNDIGARSLEGKPMTQSSVRKMLSNKYYCGFLKLGRELFKGKHQRLIDDATFERYQKNLNRRKGVN